MIYVKTCQAVYSLSRKAMEQKGRGKQECIPVGCVPPAHWPSGGSPWQEGGEGSPLQGGLLGRGEVYHVTYPIMHLMLPVCCLLTNWDPIAVQLLIYSAGARHAGIPPPPVNRITDTCKNITFPQLRLRALTINGHLMILFCSQK